MQEISDFPAYAITMSGEIFSRFKPKTNKVTDTWTKLCPVLDKGTGYYLVTLCDGTGVRKNKRIHRLLMEAFVPNPHNLPHINHKDGNKLNNSLDNLEWCSSAENAQHAVLTGLCDKRMQKSQVAVIQLTEEYTFVAEHVSLHEAGRNTGIAWQNISKVVRGLRTKAGGFRWAYK